MPATTLLTWAARRQQSLLSGNQPQFTGFILRREPFYHKLRYAKVPKFDIAAPTLGAVSGAFVAYVALATYGSSGTDMTDLTTLVWYSLVWLTNFKYIFGMVQSPSWGSRSGFVAVQLVVELFEALRAEVAPYGAHVLSSPRRRLAPAAR